MKKACQSKIHIVLVVALIAFLLYIMYSGTQQDDPDLLYWSIIQSQLTRIEYNSSSGVKVITVQREPDLEDLFVNLCKRLNYTSKANDDQGWIFRVTFNCAEPARENRTVIVLTEEIIYVNGDACIVEEFTDYPSALEKMYEIYIDLCKKYERLP